MKTSYAILGRRARLLGLLGLGMIALPGPASAMSGITLDATGRLAVNPFNTILVLSQFDRSWQAGSQRSVDPPHAGAA